VSEPCIHDLDPATCSVCNGAEKRAAAESATFRSTAERGTYGPWFAAKFSGMCNGCFEDIEPGDTIRADGDGCYLCEDCGVAA
jgi:hypothetical protein